MKIFQKVHCRGYLKKESDGVVLECSVNGQPSSVSCWDVDENVKVIAKRYYYEGDGWKEETLADLSNFEGDSVEKTYRHRVEEKFDGFLVGFTKIIVSGRIGTDYDEEHIYAGEYGEHHRYYHHLFKERNYEKVGVVYFKNNVKRYVKLEDMEG